MIGDPPVLLLDEPTSGMDPDARRHLWDTIGEERERGKCILITTHRLVFDKLTIRINKKKKLFKAIYNNHGICVLKSLF